MGDPCYGKDCQVLGAKFFISFVVSLRAVFVFLFSSLVVLVEFGSPSLAGLRFQ
jgi:hypothetical protein